MKFDFRKRRRALGYSIKNLSKKSGVSESTIKNIESNKRIARKETFELLTKALNWAIDYDQYREYIGSINKKHIKNREICESNEEIDNKIKLEKANELYKANKYEEALNIYLSFSNIFEEDGNYLFTCALLYQLLNEYEKSIEYCDKLRNYKKYKFYALILKGECLGQLGRNKEALKTFEKALEVKNNGSINYYNYPFDEISNNLRDSIEDYHKYIEILPDISCDYSNIAICYAKQFKEKKDINHFIKSIEHKDNSYEAFSNIFMDLDIAEKTEELKFYYNEFFRVHCDKIFDKNNLKKDITYVGYTTLVSQVGSFDYPTMVKVYANKNQYLDHMEKIKEHISFVQYKDKSIYFTSDYVKVNVASMEKNTLIEIVFGEFDILEVNAYVKDLDKFKELYEKYNQFRIQLECEGHIFAMDCLNNISFK